MTTIQTNNYKVRYMLEDYTCVVCGKPASQIAHLINNSVSNRKKYGSSIIDNPNNFACVCGLECNSRVSIGFKPQRILKLIDIIKSGEILKYSEIKNILEN